MVHSNRLKAFNEDKEAFYNRNSPEPANVPSSTQSQTDGQQLDDDWYEILKVTSRKKVGGKDTFLVHWTDGTTSREPAENITNYAKAQYYVAQGQRKRRRRRKKA